MLKGLTRQLLRQFRFQITRVLNQNITQQFLWKTRTYTNKNHWQEKIAKDPLNANLHLQYAIHASKNKRPYLAYAELKTAEYLGAKPNKVKKYTVSFRNDLPNPKYMNHNQYFRFVSLSSEIALRAGKTDISVLDVGGGQGMLASFIPDAVYCLAEPTVNSISGTNLPFPDRSFDYVVSCHVLEHIPEDARWLFLDQLLSKSKCGVILLNPFFIEGTHIDERLKLVIEITNAQWAKEHLDFTLPKVNDVEDYAADRGLQISIKPNGTLTTAMAFVFMDYFGAKAGLHEDWKKVNAFFNQKFMKILDSVEYPTAYLIYLGWPQAR